MSAGAAAARHRRPARRWRGRPRAGVRWQASHPALVLSPETLGRWLNRLHAFGPIRFTGTPQARAFEEFLARAFTHARLPGAGRQVPADGLGVRPRPRLRDQRHRGRQGAQDPRCGRLLSLRRLDTAARARSAAGCSTPASATTAVKALVAKRRPAELAKSIVVVDMPLANGGARGTRSSSRGAFPDPMPPNYDRPQSGAARAGGPRWRRSRTSARPWCSATPTSRTRPARYNWLPFSDSTAGRPALWVGARGQPLSAGVSGKATTDASLRRDADAGRAGRHHRGHPARPFRRGGLPDHPDRRPQRVQRERRPGRAGARHLCGAACHAPCASAPWSVRLPTGHYAAGRGGRQGNRFRPARRHPRLHEPAPRVS